MSIIVQSTFQENILNLVLLIIVVVVINMHHAIPSYIDPYGERFTSHKRARTVSFGSGDHETAHVSRGIRLYTTNDQHDIGAAKGHLWTHTYHDRRDKLERIICPLYQGMLSYASTPVDVLSGAQFATDQFLGTNAMMSGIMNMGILCGANNGNTVNPLFPIAGVGVLNAGSMGDYLSVPMLEKKFDFHNPTQYNMHLKIFEFTCRRNCSKTPIQLWNENYNTNNERFGANDDIDILASLPTALGVAFTTPTQAFKNTTTLGEIPHGKLLHEYWNLSGSVNVAIPPGRNFTYGLSTLKKRLYPYQLTVEGTFMEGWSKCIVIILTGENNVIDAVNTGNFSTSDGRLDLRVDAQCACHGVFNTMTRQFQMFDNNTLPIPAASNIMPRIATANQRGINDQTDEPETFQNNVN